ncbi:ATP-dependent RNA helicase DBP9 [Bienertia sinuspersici]
MILLMRILWNIIVTLMQFFGAIVSWQINMCLKFILWTVKITTLPIRALGALRREKKMERLLQEMQSELENLLWDNEKLTAHVKLAVKEHRFMESMLAEIEEEHDKAIGKIEFLEKEHLKDENLRLKEVQTKGIWDPAHNKHPKQGN